MESDKTIEQEAEEAWRRISGEIRRARQFRRRRNTALAAGMMVLAAVLLMMRPQSRPSGSWASTVVPSEAGTKETWAMLVFEEGDIRLESVDAGEMGSEQLPFGLEPVVARNSLVENDASGFAYGFQ
ncbi:MAG: hypothetical protein QM755_23210 [Luteolibacter sp.]